MNTNLATQFQIEAIFRAVQAFGTGVLDGLLPSSANVQAEPALADEIHRRGAQMISYADAQKHLVGTKGLWYGGLPMSQENAGLHCFLQGGTGSGKTRIIVEFLQSVLPAVKKGSKTRVIIFDPKRDFLKYAHALTPQNIPIYFLQPGDLRSTIWDVFQDNATAGQARQFAVSLIPHEKQENNRFFRDTARDLTEGVIQVLQRRALAGHKVRFRDLIVPSRKRKRLAATLRFDKSTRDLAAQHLGGSPAARDVVSTLGSCLGELSWVAACWDRDGRTISVKEFLDSESVIVIGWDDSNSEALLPIIRLFIRRLADEILRRNDSSQRTYLIFDEFPFLSKVHSLVPLATKGRSGGASMLVSVQDIADLEEAIGEKPARVLTGNLWNKLLLPVDSISAGKFASDTAGHEEILQTTMSHNQSFTSGAQPSTTTGWTRNQAITTRPLMLPDEFKWMGLPSRSNPIINLVGTRPDLPGPYRASLPIKNVPCADMPDYCPVDVKLEELQALSLGDLIRLGMDHSAELRETIGDETPDESSDDDAIDPRRIILG